jgi:hypothetical protein
MARHRSPGGRPNHRAGAPSSAPASHLRAVKVGLAAIATGALLVTGNALVAHRAGPAHSPEGRVDSALAAPAPTLAPLPPPPDPEPPRRSRATHAPQASGSGSGSSGSPGGATPASCTTTVTSTSALTQALSSAKGGDKICASGSALSGSRLTVAKGGTSGVPLQIVGTGSTVVKGITVKASNVLVSGFDVVGAKAPGIELTGSNITASNNTVRHPTGGDYDGLRFFGNNIKILNNTITDISPDGSGAHADCMQTFASDTPASQNVLINGNRCLRIDNQCLIAEGPNDGEGDGKGTTSNITFSNNTCEANASQAVMIEDVKNMVVRGNSISGKVEKAFAFDIGSTGAKVSGNKLAKGIGYEVGMDSTSRSGYQGPTIGGAP